MQVQKRNYWQYINSIIRPLGLTWQYFFRNLCAYIKKVHLTVDYLTPTVNRPVTLQYPDEKLPIPERGRYQLNNEIEDCIVCDKCAKVCPVDCIEIEAIPAPDIIGLTSNGMKKRLYAAKFDIDMAKCCFCGLCTTVCPTACLTMTNNYDFSVFNLLEHKFAFANLTEEEISQKKEQWLTHLAKKDPVT
jgi:formate hydrogenlyase subunit 6/NADH:ubiquinone oxidoreductase subunit I